MLSTLMTNSQCNASRFCGAALRPRLILTLLLAGVCIPVNGQQKNLPSPSQTASNLPASASSTAAAGPRTRPVAASAHDWRENLSKNAGAQVKIVEFFDYQCPFCAAAVPALEQALRNNSAHVQWILKSTPLSIHPDSILAHQAVLAAGEQGQFWRMHDLLLANQSKVKLPDLLDYARLLHLNVPLFRKRLESGYYKPAVEQDMALAEALGVNATPTFFVNGRKLIGAQTAGQLQAAIDGTPAPNAPASDRPAISSLDLSYSPVRGAADAPITIIEFSDFQCPFCARVTPALQALMKRYPAQIKWVFKNFPLDFHADAELAHRAALAAGQQGKFWEMHDLMFATQTTLKRNDLLDKARTLNLDMAQFTADLEGEKIMRQIEADRKEGAALRVDGTPTFYVNGRVYPGALSIDQFQAILDKELVALGRPAPAAAGVSQLAPSANEPEIAFGALDSPITLTWFSDLQSALSLKATLLVRSIIDSHPGKIRLVFKNRPLEIHPEAMLLHEAALAANAQGKFWQMHDLIIASPQKNTRQDVIAYAQRIGLDLDRFQKELDSHKYRPVIERDVQEAQRRAVLGSPVFFLNSARVDGLQNEKLFEDIITGQLTAQR